MELNKFPPELDDRNGAAQKRRTQFYSEKSKFAYDAGNLISIARDNLRTNGVESASRDELLSEIQATVESRRKDFNDSLIGSINRNLDEEEQQGTLIQESLFRGEFRTEFESFINDSELSETDRAKLLEMVSDKNYLNAVETAKEMNASKIPTYEQIIGELIKLGAEELRVICETMEQPKLLIVADQRLDENIAAMDANKHLYSNSGDPQSNAVVTAHSPSHSPYRTLPTPRKVKVSIVEGIVSPKQLGETSKDLESEMEKVTAAFAERNMRHIDVNEMATLLQQSLREAEAAEDNSLVVDSGIYEKGKNIRNSTRTLINPDSLCPSSLIATASFINGGGVFFYASVPHETAARAVGRASKTLLEI